jgi:predicted amidohydrolase YtcJ
MKKTILTIAVFSMIFGSIFCSKTKEPADLVLINGKIVTVDNALPEAEALAVKGDRIFMVGPTKEIKKFVGKETTVIDLEGKLAIPGFIDSHAHLTSLGYAKMKLDLTKVNNWDDVIQMVSEAVKEAKPGEWILGRGWHQEKWDKTPEPNLNGLPIHTALSRISPDNPVLLTHASGHSCFANGNAMALAGITGKTPNPDGGEIVKDSAGNPIGIFRETAQRIFSKARASQNTHQSEAEKLAHVQKAIDLAVKECLKNGITSFHDAGTSFSMIELYKKMAEEKKMKIRINAMISERNNVLKEKIQQYKILGAGNNHLTVRSIKRLIDGALGAHGAWLLEPYKSLPSSTGLNTEQVDYMTETARIAIQNGFQLNTHAIGDRANRETLNIYEKVFKEFPEKKNLRWRIEHSQHLHPDDIGRFGQLGIIPSMQGIHCTSDGPWVFKRLGEKRAEEGAYVWQKLMKSGAVICNGTDAPVEDVSPIACYYASVSRRLKDGTLFFPDQRMTRIEALKSYTINGAYASFEEGLKGSLTPGKLADITVLSQDILTVPEEKIPDTEVLYTIVGGEIQYQK